MVRLCGGHAGLTVSESAEETGLMLEAGRRAANTQAVVLTEGPGEPQGRIAGAIYRKYAEEFSERLAEVGLDPVDADGWALHAERAVCSGGALLYLSNTSIGEDEARVQQGLGGFYAELAELKLAAQH